MAIWFKRLVLPPVFEDEEETRVARLLNTVLLTFFVAVSLVAAAVLVLYGIPGPSAELLTLISAVAALLITAGLLGLTHRGYLRAASVILLTLIWALITFWICTVAGIRSDTSTLTYPLVVVLAGLLLGGRAAVAYTVLSLVSVFAGYYVEANGFLEVAERDLTLMDPVMAGIPVILVGLLLRHAVNSMLDALAQARRNEQAQIKANRELDAIRLSLEERVAERTRDLERRSTYLQAAAKVGRAAISILEIEKLMWRVVELVQVQFDLYHVSIFLLDETGRFAEYRAGAGAGGRALQEEGFRLDVGGPSLIGWCTANAQARVVQDVREDVPRVEHARVPESLSEAALPLVVRDTVIGAFSVQSDRPGMFDQDTVVALQSIADQVAVALDNARLFAETEAALEAERRAYGDISREAWADLARERPDKGYLCGLQGMVRQVGGDWKREMVEAGQAGKVVQSDELEVSIPVRLQDQVVGVVRLRKPEGQAPWTREEIALMETITDRLGLTLESARLYRDSLRRAAREQSIRRVTEQMRRPREVEAILQNTLAELTRALGVPQAYVRLGTKATLPRVRDSRPEDVARPPRPDERPENVPRAVATGAVEHEASLTEGAEWGETLPGVGTDGVHGSA